MSTSLARVSMWPGPKEAHCRRHLLLIQPPPDTVLMYQEEVPSSGPDLSILLIQYSCIRWRLYQEDVPLTMSLLRSGLSVMAKKHTSTFLASLGPCHEYFHDVEELAKKVDMCFLAITDIEFDTVMSSTSQGS